MRVALATAALADTELMRSDNTTVLTDPLTRIASALVTTKLEKTK